MPVSSSEGPESTPAESASARIAAQVTVLDTMGDLPLADHIEIYHRLHTELQAALAEIDGP